MSVKPVWQDIENHIGRATGEPFRCTTVRTVGGGCINEAFCLEGNGRRYFAKLNAATNMAMFEAEAAGLGEILNSQTLRAPTPIAWGTTDDQSWLALEYIHFASPKDNSSARLGEQLARMHRHTKEQFGWHRDNTIGATPQLNNWTSDWIEFLRDRRLGYQLSLSSGRRAPNRVLDLGQQLLEKLPIYFEGHQALPSLLHGDLWGGNWATDDTGAPVIFDPAVYFGDREADLAMTELFGGFDQRFYDAYRAAWPLDPGYATRKTLYNLYHVLNHFNLFGGGYATQAESMLERLLATA